MSIRRKFVVSNFLMLVIPFLATAAIAAVFLARLYLMLPDKSGQIYESLQKETELSEHLLLAFVIVILVIVVTNIVITAVLSRTILRPLSKLKEAADNIKDGNLDFEVIGSEDKEIAELCDAFDQMRRRLKASVAQRIVDEKEQNMLLANISHDLRTPMTSIKGYLEGISDGVANTPEKMEKYLATILEKVDIMDNLIEQLSEYSKMELGRVQYHFKTVDYLQFVRSVIDSRELDLSNAGMQLAVRLPEERYAAVVDTEQLRRAFTNIIDNAIKYKKPDSGKLSITATYEQNGICLVFSDSGIGIKDEDLHKVFDGFYRGDASRTPQVEGHGLGLALVKKIIEAHRGKVWIKSTQNEGTSVYCFLPVRIKTEGDGSVGE